jgi:tetratricopeptide (TPR) repeat protein
MYGVESVLRGRLGDSEGCFKAAILAGSQGSKDDAIPQLIESATRNYAAKYEKEALDAANSAEPAVAKCVLVGLSRHRQEKRDFAGGEALAARAIALDERYADAWLWRAHARYRQSKWTESLEDYEKAVAIKPAWKAQFKARMDEVRKHLEQ